MSNFWRHPQFVGPLSRETRIPGSKCQSHFLKPNCPRLGDFVRNLEHNLVWPGNMSYVCSEIQELFPGCHLGCSSSPFLERVWDSQTVCQKQWIGKWVWGVGGGGVYNEKMEPSTRKALLFVCVMVLILIIILRSNTRFDGDLKSIFFYRTTVLE